MSAALAGARIAAEQYDKCYESEQHRFPVEDAPKTVKPRPKDVFASARSRLCGRVTGYSTRWVKRFLQQQIHENLVIVLNCDFPRTIELVPTEISKRSDSAGNSSPRRFSILSGCTFRGNKATNDESSVLGLINCPIIGPVIASRFISLWWNVDLSQASNWTAKLTLRSFLYDKAASLQIRSSSIGHYIKPEEEILPEFLQRNVDRPDKLIARSRIVTRELSLNQSKIFRIVMTAEKTRSLFDSFQELGIFNSFSLANTADDDSQVNERIVCNRRQLLLLAEKLLPVAMTVPTAADTVLLSEPILTIAPEASAQLAAEIAAQLLSAISCSIFPRLIALDDVLSCISEAEGVLANLDLLKEQLDSNVDELLAAIRSQSSLMQKIRDQQDNVDKLFQKEAFYESERFLREDIFSRSVELNFAEESINASISDLKHSFGQFSAADWADLSSVFSVRPAREFIDIMRACMIITNYVPPKSLKLKNLAGGKMDDETVCRCSSTFLRTLDCSSQLIAINPLTILPNQLAALKTMNQILNTQENCNSLLCLPAHCNLQVEDDNLSPISRTILRYLKRFALVLEVYHNFCEHAKVKRAEIDEAKALLQTVENRVEIERTRYVESLAAKSDHCLEILHQLDDALLENRKKTGSWNRLKSSASEIRSVLDEWKSTFLSEKKFIQEMMECAAGDCCVAAAVSARASWLPEEIRQETLEKIRDCLKQKSVVLSSTPFLLGSFQDRMQAKTWSSISRCNLSRDVETINSMSLILLLPRIVFVFDPDGTSAPMLQSNAPSSFEAFSIPCRRFTVAMLECWLNDCVSRHCNAFIVLTDAQAGISTDLCALMSQSSKSNEDLLSNPWRLARINNLRIKIVITSTRAQIALPSGESYPFPACCTNEMVFVHWPLGAHSGFVVNPDPVAWALGMRPSASQTLGNQFANCFSDKIENGHIMLMQSTQLKLLHFTRELKSIDDSVILSIMRWLKREQQEENDVTIAGVLFHPVVLLSCIGSELVLRSLLVKSTQKTNCVLSLKCVLSLERELFGYQAVLIDMFSMSCEFLKLISSLIPSELFPPFTLSPCSLCSKWLQPTMAKGETQKRFAGFPSSLESVRKLVESITCLQNRFRKRKSGVDVSFVDVKPMGQSNVVAQKCSRFPNLMILLSNSEDLATMRFTQSSPKSRGTTRHSVLSGGRNVGVASSERGDLMDALRVFTAPLRSLFLTEVVEYCQRSVRPGLEWIVRLVLTICIWSQTREIAVVEVRSLFRLIVNSAGVGISRFISCFPLSEIQFPEMKVECCQQPVESNSNSGIVKNFEAWHTLVGRGPGVIDGLFLHRKSSMWNLSCSSRRFGILPPCSSRIVLCFSDESFDIIRKPRSEPAISVTRDPFEVEWLQLSGVKIFSTTTEKALKAIGASEEVIAAIDRSISSSRQSYASSPKNMSSRNQSSLRERTRISMRRSIKESGHSRNSSFFSRKLSRSSTLSENVNAEVSPEIDSRRSSKIARTSHPMISRVSGIFAGIGVTRRSMKINKSSLPDAPRIIDRRKSNVIGVVDCQSFCSISDNMSGLKIIESHSGLSSIFSGTSAMLTKYADDFKRWKELLLEFGALDFAKMNDVDKEEAIGKIIPPTYSNIDGKGIWSQGFELSGIETMILAEILKPGTAGIVARVFFSGIQTFLRIGCKMVKLNDEVSDDDEDDVFDEMMESPREEDEDIDEIGDSFFVENPASHSCEIVLSRTGLFQDIVATNCWTKLKRFLSGQYQSKGYTLRLPKWTGSSLTCRDFEDWESCLSFALEIDQGVEKYVYMQSLRDLFHRSLNSIFICNAESMNQLPLLSQRARMLGVHNNCTVTVVNSSAFVKPYSFDVNDGNQISEMLRVIRSAGQANKTGRVIFESSNITSMATGTVLGTFSSSQCESASNSQCVPMIAVVVSAPWGTKNQFGRGPSNNASGWNFLWLPRLTAPDIVGSRDGTSQPFARSMVGIPPNVEETGGVLLEALEQDLLWTMVSCRYLTRTTITSALLKRLRFANKLQIRATSALLAIWRLLCFRRCSALESAGSPGFWSDALVPLSLWQFARLLIKVSDMLEQDWVFETETAATKPFGFAMPSNHEAAGLITDARFQSAILSICETFLASDAREPRPDYYFGELDSGGHENNEKHLLPENVVIPKAKGSSSIALKFITKRGERRAASKAAQVISNRLQSLRSVERFSFLRPSRHGPNDTRIPSPQDDAREQLFALIALYLSEVVVISRASKSKNQGVRSIRGGYLLSGEPENDKWLGSESSTRRISSKIDLSAKSVELSRNSVKSLQELRDSTDISVGGFSSIDLMQCLVRWSIDASNPEVCHSVETNSGVSKHQLMAKFRRSILLAAAKLTHDA